MLKTYEFKDVNKFMEEFKQGTIQFPYKRLLYKDDEIKKMFQYLKKEKYDDRISEQYYKINNIKIQSNQLLYLNQPRLFITKNSDYEKFDMLSDMFNEENRMKCTFFSAKSSPEEYFYNNTKKLVEKTFKLHKIITPKTLRDEIYYSIKECSAFRPINLVYIIKLFGSKSVLDPCSGWGDRLIASISADVRYVGVDPNILLLPKYKKMIEFFAPKNKHNRYTMIQSTIQDAKLPNEKFDLVFTSPPYFKIEKYSNAGEVVDSNEHEWFNNFMIPMIQKTYEKLKYNGHMVLVINQMPNEHYISKMQKYIYNMKDMHYLGVISYVNYKLVNPQPMWIWKKSKKIPEELYNPVICITKHSEKILNKQIKFSVIRDDKLIGGTKQRGMIPLLATIKQNKIIYAGPTQGFEQVAVAYACKLLHKTAVLFLSKPKSGNPNHRTDLTKYALSFGSVELHEIKNGYLKKVQYEAEQYNKSNDDSYILAFGGNECSFPRELEKSIKKSISTKIHPNRMWIVAGSATILTVLYKIYPKTYFMVVQVGKVIRDNQIEHNRTTLYISKEDFRNPACDQPPYPSISTYDAKLWVFFKKHGKSGDYIWNVGKDPYFNMRIK
jgi:16S rRNA G966 N2-methylase RsmD